MVNIRRARDGDLPSILGIETESFGRDAWDREVLLDYFTRPDRAVFLVAIIDDVVAGYALGRHSRIRAEIHSVAVAPEHRRHGIAVKLLKRVIGLLQRRGFESVGLNVRLNNLMAIGLYRRLGFQRVRRVIGYYEDGAPAWRMRRRPRCDRNSLWVEHCSANRSGNC